MSTRERIDEVVARAGSRGHDALAIGVVAHGEATFRGDETALFEIGSITKVFTGVLLADMYLRGEVGLDEPVSKYVPAEQLPHRNVRAPTLGELATHRAALPNAPRGLGRKESAFALGLRSSDPWADVDVRAYRELVRGTSARRPPGERFGYSSLGFGLLGDALAARAGVTYEQLLEDRISGPLGLLDTAISVPRDKQPRLLEGRSRRGHPRPPLRDEMPAAGAIRSSTRDLLRFLTCSLGQPETAPGPALRLATQPHARINRRLDIGLGWMILRRKGQPELIWHSGGTWGFRSFAALVLERELGVVVLANTVRSVDRLGFKLVDLLTGRGRTA